MLVSSKDNDFYDNGTKKGRKGDQIRMKICRYL